MKRCFIPLLLGLCLAMASCTEYSKVINSTDLDYKYKVAQEYYNKGQYARAAVLLQDVIQRFKGTENGEESLYMLGMSQFGAKGMAEQGYSYRDIILHYFTGVEIRRLTEMG